MRIASRLGRRVPGSGSERASRRPSHTGSAGATLELAALALREAAPDPEALVVVERVLEAFAADIARCADPLGVAGGPALLGEEGLGIGLRAERIALPCQSIVVVGLDLPNPGDTEVDRIDEPVLRYV